MKSADKKNAGTTHVPQPEQTVPDKKQSSGDQLFDAAIDRLLKKPTQHPVQAK